MHSLQRRPHLTRYGEYHVRLDQGAISDFSYPDKAVCDAPGEGYHVDTRRVRGANEVSAGLLCQVRDKNDFLLFVVYNDGAYALYAKVNGRLQSLVDPEISSAIRPNAANRLQVFSQGAVLNLVVNARYWIRSPSEGSGPGEDSSSSRWAVTWRRPKSPSGITLSSSGRKRSDRGNVTSGWAIFARFPTAPVW